MADTASIEETFGLTAVEEYGGKVRLWTEAELWPWIDQEVSVGRSLGRPEAEIRVNIASRYGEAGLRLYLKADRARIKRPPDRSVSQSLACGDVLVPSGMSTTDPADCIP